VLRANAIDCDPASFRPVGAQQTTYTSQVSRIRGHTRDGEELALFVKVSRPDVHPEIKAAFAREIDFYVRVARRLGAPLLNFRGGHYEPLTGHGVVVLDDVTATHEGPVLPVMPRPDRAVSAVSWLARLHAETWRAAMLADLTAAPPPADLVAETTHAFLGFLGSRLPAPARQRLVRATASIASWYPHAATGPPLVLLFGDAHFYNFLYARGPDTGPPVLACDWQHWSVGAPGYDLATLIAMHLSREQRRSHEMRLLRQYLSALRAHGVTEYTWDNLLRDYREHVRRHVTVVPAWQWSVGVPKTVWWQQLELGLAAWQDLGIDEL
jgi:aminoglycoside/choline kinase family phosphotransferase